MHGRRTGPALMFYLFARDAHNKRLYRFGERKLVERLLPFASVNKPWLRMFLVLFALLSLVLAGRIRNSVPDR